MLTNEIAIVGIDGQFGEFANIDRVARALYIGKEVGKKVGKNTSSGLAESSTTVGINATANTNIASLISSKVSASTARMFDALTQQKSSAVPAPLDVIIIFENGNASRNEINDQQVSDLTANLSAQSHINSAVVVSQLSGALTLAVSLIDKGRLVALVGLSVTSTNPITQQSTVESNNTISFDSHFTGYQPTAGLASLLLAPQAIAKSEQLPIYAQLNGLSICTVNANAMKAAVLESLKNAKACQFAGKAAANMSLIEVSALEDEFHSALESSVLLEAYRESYAVEPLTCAISCARSITGEGAGFSQVLGLLRTVIALQQRYIPGINSWQAPKKEQLVCNTLSCDIMPSNVNGWHSSNFYFPTESRTRYPNADGSKHSAAYSCLTQDSYCHLVLTEYPLNKSEDIRLNGFLASSDLHLILVNGDDEAQLQQKLLQLSQLTSSQGKSQSHDDLKMMADQQYQQYLTSSLKKYTVVLLAESIEELTKEIQLAQQGIKNVFVNLSQTELGKTIPTSIAKSIPTTTASSLTQWKTPKGSYFSATPAAYIEGATADKTNNVCFMYPGIGATYVGLGRDLFQLFPEIYPEVANLADDIGSSLKDTLLNPRSISRLDFKALKQRDLDLRGSLADIAEAGVGFACVFSKIFTKVFKLNADFATGYSMGEVSMYAALGCWQQPGLMSARLANSATFNERLCGDLLTLREHWQLPLPSANPNPNTNTNTNTESVEAPIWETYTIKATLAEVEEACLGETRVYCTIINTPDSVLLAGYPVDCLRVIAKLGVRAMPLNMANAIHSAPAKAEYDDMVALYTMAVNARINTKLYSSSCYLPVPQLSKAIANSIAKCLCDRVDFPRLVNTLYNNGARVFIEMGPGRSLCSWVDKILEHEHKQHQHQKNIPIKDGNNNSSVSVPVNAKGVSDELTYFRAIAKLVSHGVTLDLNSLFYGSIVINKKLTATKHNSNTAQLVQPS